MHRPHLGVEATQRRARETVFWPRLSSELRDYVSQCDTCRSFDPEQQKEPLINHDIVTQVWAKVGVDLFTFENRDYIVTVDYLTNFWEVDHLRDDTSARSVIRKLKLNFARYGIPQKLVSDNGPQFTSQEFKIFTDEWEIEHDLTSPYHPQANGKAESAVKMAKTLMKKARHSKSDFYLMLLEYRNTSTQVLGTTPAQRMLCRTIRSRLPAKAATREQKPVDMKHLTEQVEKAQRKQERTYNRGSKRLAPLNRGQAVRIRHRGIWEQGTIERQEGGKGRSYVVQLTTGGFYRRNRRDIRAARSDPLTSLSQEEDNVLTKEDVAQPSVVDSPTTPRSDTPEMEERAEATQSDHVTVTRSGRVVKRPSRFNDYNCD